MAVIFDDQDLSDIEQLTVDEMKVFVKFLKSEERRHHRDIEELRAKIDYIEKKIEEGENA